MPSGKRKKELACLVARFIEQEQSLAEKIEGSLLCQLSRVVNRKVGLRIVNRRLVTADAGTFHVSAAKFVCYQLHFNQVPPATPTIIAAVFAQSGPECLFCDHSTLSCSSCLLTKVCNTDRSHDRHYPRVFIKSQWQTQALCRMQSLPLSKGQVRS